MVSNISLRDIIFIKYCLPKYNVSMDKNNKRSRIFLAYKRSCSWELARLIYDNLKNVGFDPFLDVEKLPNIDFEDNLFDAINKSEIFLLFVTRDTLNKCLDENDWLLKELIYAIKLNKRILVIKDSSFDLSNCKCNYLRDFLNNQNQQSFTFDANTFNKELQILIHHLKNN